MSTDVSVETRPETGFVRTNDIETYYERRGEGPTVVFVHAAVMDHSMWDPQVEALSGDYTTVVYDVRGHGRTGGSARDAYTVDLYVADLDALLAGLELDRPVLCGHSMGGLIAGAYAARYPERVAGVVLGDTFTPELDRASERLQLAFMRLAIPLVRLLGIGRVQRFRSWVYERFSRGASGDYDAIERIQAAAPQMSTDEFAKVIRSMVRVRDVDVDYGAISAPTLVMYGENAPAFLRRQAALLGDLVPDAEVHEIPGAGHGSNVDNPGFYAARVRDILEAAFGRD